MNGASEFRAFVFDSSPRAVPLISIDSEQPPLLAGARALLDTRVLVA